eukprot:Opistho-1_new@67166
MFNAEWAFTKGAQSSPLHMISAQVVARECLGNRGRDGEELERLLPRHGRDGVRTRVRDPEVPKALANEPPPALAREHGVRHVEAHRRRSTRSEGPCALEQRAARLHEIVHNDDVPPCDVTLLDRDNPPRAVPDLCADNSWPRTFVEKRVETLMGALVWKCDGRRGGVGQFLQSLYEERDGRLQPRNDLVTEVKALLERVDVVDEYLCWALRRQRNGRQHRRKALRRDDLTLNVHALHRARGEVRQYEGERARKVPWKRVDDGELLEYNRRVVEARKQQHVVARHVLDVFNEHVGKAVLEILPAHIAAQNNVPVAKHRARRALAAGVCVWRGGRARPLGPSARALLYDLREVLVVILHLCAHFCNLACEGLHGAVVIQEQFAPHFPLCSFPSRLQRPSVHSLAPHVLCVDT